MKKNKKGKNLGRLNEKKTKLGRVSKEDRKKRYLENVKKQYGIDKTKKSTMKKKSTMRKNVPTERQANMSEERRLNKKGSKLNPKDALQNEMRKDAFKKADALADERYRRNKAGNPMKLKSRNVANATAKKTSPALAKLSASCKAAAKRKFKVYPSAYANMWAAKTQRQGKC